MDGYSHGDVVALSHGFDGTLAGQSVELLSDPDEGGMVRVRLADSFFVSVNAIRALIAHTTDTSPEET